MHFKKFLNELKPSNQTLIENIENAFEILFENEAVSVLSMSDDGHIVIRINDKVYEYKGLDGAVAKARYKQFKHKPFKFVNWIKDNYQLIKTQDSDEWFTREEFENK